MIKSVYKSGSSVILPKSNDIDYICYCETEEDRKEALIGNRDREIDKHYVLISNATRVFLGCYIYPYMEHIEGEEIDGLKEFSILDHKQEYTKFVRKCYLMTRSTKRWYHVAIAYFMFKNNRLTLTDEEIAIAQQVHDKGISESLYNSIRDYFGEA